MLKLLTFRRFNFARLTQHIFNTFSSLRHRLCVILINVYMICRNIGFLIILKRQAAGSREKAKLQARVGGRATGTFADIRVGCKSFEF